MCPREKPKLGKSGFGCLKPDHGCLPSQRCPSNPSHPIKSPKPKPDVSPQPLSLHSDLILRACILVSYDQIPVMSSFLTDIIREGYGVASVQHPRPTMLRASMHNLSQPTKSKMLNVHELDRARSCFLFIFLGPLRPVYACLTAAALISYDKGPLQPCQSRVKPFKEWHK